MDESSDGVKSKYLQELFVEFKCILHKFHLGAGSELSVLHILLKVSLSEYTGTGKCRVNNKDKWQMGSIYGMTQKWDWSGGNKSIGVDCPRTVDCMVYL